MDNNNEEVNKLNILRETTPKHANYIYLITIIMQLLVSVIFGTVIYAGLLIFKNGNEERYFEFFMSPFVEILAILGPVIVYYLIYRLNFKKDLKLNKLSLIQIPFLIVIGVCAQYVGGFINYLFIMFLQVFGKVPNTPIQKPENTFEIVFALITIAILPAICEEILCRGFLLNGYKKYGIKVAIVVSALFFGLMHMDITNFIFPVFLGLILGYVVYRTNSILSAMLIHFTNNGLALVLLITGEEDTSEYYQVISREDFLSYAMIAGIGAIILFSFLYVVYKTTNRSIEDIDIVSEDKKRFSPIILFHWPLLITYIITISFFVSSIIGIVD